MKKKLTLTIVIILVVLLVAGAAVWYFVFYNTDRIGGKAAEDAALAHAGFSRNEVSALKSDYEHDDGLRYYEVSFVRETTEYEYAIDSVTGEVLNVKTESVFD